MYLYSRFTCDVHQVKSDIETRTSHWHNIYAFSQEYSCTRTVIVVVSDIKFVFSQFPCSIYKIKDNLFSSILSLTSKTIEFTIEFALIVVVKCLNVCYVAAFIFLTWHNKDEFDIWYDNNYGSRTRKNTGLDWINMCVSPYVWWYKNLLFSHSRYMIRVCHRQKYIYLYDRQEYWYLQIRSLW
jgi:hypothetical protein